MSEHMCNISKIDNKIDNLHEKIDKVILVQVEQAADIKHHIARTDALEKMIVPVYKLKLQLVGIIKFILGIAALGGLITLIKFFLLKE